MANGSTLAQSIQNFLKDALAMEPFSILTHLVAFIVILAAILVWVWKPTNDFINRQKKKLESERVDLVVNNREARYFLGLLKKERYELFYSKRAIVKAAVEESRKLRAEAKEASEKMLAEAQVRADERVKAIESKAKDQIKKYIVEAAIELTEKLVDANVNEASNKAVIDAYIKQLESKQIMSSSERSV